MSSGISRFVNAIARFHGVPSSALGMAMGISALCCLSVDFVLGFAVSFLFGIRLTQLLTTGIIRLVETVALFHGVSISG